jgi:hypothetical protein
VSGRRGLPVPWRMGIVLLAGVCLFLVVVGWVIP